MIHATVAIAAVSLLAAPLAITAQGVTTAGIRGTATVSDHRRPDVLIRVVEDATGFAVEVRVRNGRYFVQGLQPGGPYSVTARALGYAPQSAAGITLTLGELRELNFELMSIGSAATVLQATEVRARRHEDGGTGTTIPNAWFDQLPTLNRDLYDFVRLVAQISTKVNVANPGLSAGGAGFRYNSFLVNGISERTLSGGVSAAFAGNKSVPLGAVQEYEVLLAPYDVRYGDFAGALINTVTKSGTNRFAGSVFAYGRNDRLRRTPDSTSVPYDRAQYGFTLGGPVIQNRLHFFVAPELQYYTYPADGPYLGQSGSAVLPMRVSAADVSRFDAIMRGYGLAAGSAGAIENSSPLRNVFARVDLAVPKWNSRVVAWHNYGGNNDRGLSRINTETFSFSSYQVTRNSRSRLSAAQMLTALGMAGGGSNELLMSYKSDGQEAVSSVRQPIVRVSVPAVSDGNVTLLAGSNETAHGGQFRGSSVSLKDNLTLPIGASHAITFGAEWERFRIDRGASNNAYGIWTFGSLNNFERGLADRYEVRVDLKRAPRLTGSQYALYVSDQWRPNARLSLTGGVRSDLLALDGRALYAPTVDSVFGRRTDQMPRPRVELSPRLGVIWNMPGGGKPQLRGGAGIFTGRYPLAWAHAALAGYGAGGTLVCTLLGSATSAPPEFNPDYRSPPQTCAGGQVPRTDVNLIDRNVRMVRVARASLAYEREIRWGLRLVGEALASRSLSDFAFRNLNLTEPIGADRNGRVMYGTIGPNAVASPAGPRAPGYNEVIDLRNVSGNDAYQWSATLETDRTKSMTGSISYTYSRAEDVQTPNRVNTSGTVAWSSARVNSGRDDDLTTTTTSSNDIPHRVIVTGTWTLPWKYQSQLAFYYVGESGRPFTYTSFGASRRGDLNADGSNANDPIFVPGDAENPNDVRFGQPAQGALFERFISSRSCLDRQRGRIMERNSCYEPWSNTTIASVRQTFPIGKRAFDAQLDVFNVLNLLNEDWGLRRTAASNLLEHIGQTGSGPEAQSVFALNPNALKWTTLADESSFQLQLALRYRF